MELEPYWAVLRKWYRVILGLTLAAALAALLLSFILPPTYEAEAQAAIVKSGTLLNFDPKFKTVSELDSAVDLPARRRALVTIGKNPDIAASVIPKLGDMLDQNERVPTNLTNLIDVSLDGDLIKIKARATNPQKAAQLANAWVQEYQARVNDLYGDAILSPSELRAQADAARRDYDEKEKALVGFTANNSIEPLNRQIAQRQQKLMDLVAIENRVERLLADANALRSKMTSSSSSSFSDELTRVLLEVNAFSTSSSLPANYSTIAMPSAPTNTVQPINLQLRIDQLAASATPAEQLRNVDALIATLEERRKVVQAEANGPLQQEINQLQAQLEQETAKKLDLTHARDIASTALTTLMYKLAEVTIAEQAKNTVIRLALPAIPPQDPVAPRKSVNTILAAVIGLFASTGFAFFVESVRKRIATSEQVAAVLNLKTAGTIPEFQTHKPARALLRSSPNGSDGVIALHEPRSLPSEAFRLLQHNLQANGAAWKVLLIASALPGEGKSTVAANLATLIAATGKRVTLVDANFRHPSLHDIFQLKNDCGLQDLLSGSAADPELCGQATRVDNLRVIPAGEAPLDPASLLASPSFERLIERLRATSDFVLIDAPAVLGLADAALLARGADAILLVIASDSLSPRDAVNAKELLTETGAPLMTVALNRVKDLPSRSLYPYNPSAVQASSDGSGGDRRFSI